MAGYGALPEDDYGEGSPLSFRDDHPAGPSNRNGHVVPGSPSASGGLHRPGGGVLESRGRQGSGGLRGLANYLREKTSQASTNVAQRDWSSEQQAVQQVRNKTARLQNSAAKGWLQAKEATVDGYRKVTGGALAGVCRAEAGAQPCPRAVLVCCSAIVCGGLATEGLFRRDAPVDTDAVHWLLGGLHAGSGVVLPAAGTSAHVIAAALIQWLHTLEEPLLTYKLLPAFIAAGRDAPLRGTVIMKQLPPANLNSLQLLLETWHRLAAHFAINGMDARNIAENVATALAWHPPPPASKQQSYMALASDAQPASLDSDDDSSQPRGDDEAFGAPGPRTDLTPPETEAMVNVIERMIESFTHAVAQRDSGIYQGPSF